MKVTQAKPPLFAETSDETLLGYGVPEEWLTDVRQTDGESLLTLVYHLPAEPLRTSTRALGLPL